MKTNPEDQAFTVFYREAGANHSGLTKREYFAAMALQGLLSDAQNLITPEGSTCSAEAAASAAVKTADELIKALNA